MICSCEKYKDQIRDLISELSDARVLLNRKDSELIYARSRLRVCEKELQHISNRRSYSLDAAYVMLDKERQEAVHGLAERVSEYNILVKEINFILTENLELREEVDKARALARKHYNKAYVMARLNKLPVDVIAELIEARMPRTGGWKGLILPKPQKFAVNITMEGDDG